MSSNSLFYLISPKILKLLSYCDKKQQILTFVKQTPKNVCTFRSVIKLVAIHRYFLIHQQISSPTNHFSSYTVYRVYTGPVFVQIKVYDLSITFIGTVWTHHSKQNRLFTFFLQHRETLSCKAVIHLIASVFSITSTSMYEQE